ncbi:MAG: N-acetylmuramoyl-L-alanine amidase, partial [Alphaproteobacteria bacterium]|nr:N-acetylmuramoyl-L-alanine amidase [Alphaproteobacteria bacterium]
AVLLESGFVSNPKEVEKLRDPSYRNQMARAITSGIDSYFMRLAALRTQ